MSPNLYLEFKFIPTPILEQHRVAAVDSWTWDNDSEADRKYITRAEEELAYRKKNEPPLVVFLDYPEIKQWYSLEYVRDMQREMAKSMMVDSSLL